MAVDNLRECNLGARDCINAQRKQSAPVDDKGWELKPQLIGTAQTERSPIFWKNGIGERSRGVHSTRLSLGSPRFPLGSQVKQQPDTRDVTMVV